MGSAGMREEGYSTTRGSINNKQVGSRAWILTVANAVDSDDFGEICLEFIANQARDTMVMILPSQYRNELNDRCPWSTICGLPLLRSTLFTIRASNIQCFTAKSQFRSH